jgi:hypothetical protein
MRMYVLERAMHARIPRTITRLRGEPVQTTRPPTWRCVGVFGIDDAFTIATAAGCEQQIVADGALTAEQIARYDAEAQERRTASA